MKRSTKKSNRVYKKRNDGTSDFELGLALSNDFDNSEALSRLAILEKENLSLRNELKKKDDCCKERDSLKKKIIELEDSIKLLVFQIDSLNEKIVFMDKTIKNLRDELEKKNKEIDAILIGISRCGKDETLLNELKKQLKERNEEIMKLHKEIARLNEEIARLTEEISDNNRTIKGKDKEIARLNDEMARLNEEIAKLNEEMFNLNQIIAEKDRIIQELKDSQISDCEFLNSIYNNYINDEIDLSRFLQNIKDFIERYCGTELPRYRSSIPLPRPRPIPLPIPIPRPLPRYREPTESSKLGYDAAGGKMGRSSDGSKKKRSKKVLKKSPRRSRKLKRSSKKKRN